MTAENALYNLKYEMQSDSDYAWSWHCAVAVCFKDEGGTHEASNKAAARFMKLAFDAEYEDYKPITHMA
jgi:hypothetical protein